ncbi:type VI secretion system protein TssA [Erwinia sp. CGal63]|uniref:type VI secretion system protein TssA n=1 Tax=Erwinia sp. CGal63 TaxID=2919889 RepID=UPI00300993BF
MTEHAYYQTLLQPVSSEQPCGENLEYDAGFIMLQARLQPKLDAEYGSFVEAAEPVNWAEIERDCQTLLQRSRDIRLIVALIRCRIRQIGAPALCEGLLILRDLLTAFPQHLYPQLTEEGEFDPVMRANALAELEDIDGLLADLRNLPLPKAAGLQIAIKDFEKAHATPREEGALPEATAAALLLEWQARQDANILSLQKAAACLTELQALLAPTLGDEAPDFSRLKNILQLFVTHQEAPALPTSYVEAVSEEQVLRQETPPESVTTADPLPAPRQGDIASRTDALLRLQELRMWFTRMEPGSPAILLLQFAERTIGKSFAELVKMLPPEIIDKLDPDRQ